MTTPTTNEPLTVPHEVLSFDRPPNEPSTPTPRTTEALVDHMPEDASEWSFRYLELSRFARKLETELSAERDAKFRAIECAANALEDAQKWREVAESLEKSFL